MTRIKTWATALGLLAITFNAVADDLNIEITPFGAYRFGGTFDVTNSDMSFELDDSSSYGLIINFREKQDTQWEVLYSRQKTDASLSGAAVGTPLVDVDLQVLQLGGTYQGHGDTVRPYLAATIGGTHIKARSTGSASETFWSGSIGLGIQIRPNSRLGIRLEARAYGTFIETNSEIFCGSGPAAAGCTVRIDGKVLSQIETIAGIVFRF
jgi:hypothetical protein